jgi:gamma-glutamylcyclotransferase (GGCT)/AIG2-like uncharacterized protein YtfP
MSRHTSLAETRRSGPASVRGTLWDLDPYQALVKGTGLVTGKLCEVDDDMLRRIDEVGGFDQDDFRRYQAAPKDDQILLIACCGKARSVPRVRRLSSKTI